MTVRGEVRRVAMVVYNDLAHDARVFKEARALIDAGYSVEVIGMCDGASGPLAGWDDVSVARVSVGRAKSLRARYAVFWWRACIRLIALRPDAIHAHDLDVVVPCCFAARWLGVPLVHDAHELWTELPSLVGRPIVRGVWSAIARAVVPRCDVVMTVSDGVAAELGRRHGVDVRVVRNCPQRTAPAQPAPIRAELGIASETPILLYQGGLLQGLGVERAIDMMVHLRDMHLVIVGDGPLRGDLTERAARSPVRDGISFIPAVPFAELPPITAAADLGLHLGESDGLNTRLALPNKLFEYVAAGLPVVATDWPEVGKVVRRYDVGGTVAPGGSAEDAAQVVRSVLADRDRLAANARVAAEQLVWDREAPVLVESYAQLPWRPSRGRIDGAAR